jgi:membrane protein DedA with SNARE-associated domain
VPSRWRFLGYTLVGAASWTGTLVGLGWALGRRWRIVEFYTSSLAFGMLAALVLVILWFLWRRWKTHR